jgi:hypothetical protein
MLTQIAADLVAWLRLLALDGALAKAEPKALRYRMLHVPARLVRSSRRRRIRSPRPGPGRRHRGGVRPDRRDPTASLTVLSAHDPRNPEDPQPGSASRPPVVPTISHTAAPARSGRHATTPPPS